MLPQFPSIFDTTNNTPTGSSFKVLQPHVIQSTLNNIHLTKYFVPTAHILRVNTAEVTILVQEKRQKGNEEERSPTILTSPPVIRRERVTLGRGTSVKWWEQEG